MYFHITMKINVSLRRVRECWELVDMLVTSFFHAVLSFSANNHLLGVLSRLILHLTYTVANWELE